jgi:hypothetical protein
VTAVDAATLTGTSVGAAVPSVHIHSFLDCVPSRRRSHLRARWLAVEELDDVVGELLRVLVEEAVIRIGVDVELGVWKLLGE